MFDGVMRGVRPVFVNAHNWPVFASRVRPYLCKIAAGSRGCFLSSDIEELIESNAYQVWLAFNGNEIVCVMLTEVVQMPRKRALRAIGIVGRKPRTWMHLLEVVERVACRDFGCDLIQALHQPGHGRLLQTDGWKTFHILSEKELG